MDSVSEKQLFIMPINNLDIILEIYKTIKESSPNLVVILTGRCCSYRRSERIKRDASSDNSTFVVKSNRVLLYSSQPLSLKVTFQRSSLESFKLGPNTLCAANA